MSTPVRETFAACLAAITLLAISATSARAQLRTVAYSGQIAPGVDNDVPFSAALYSRLNDTGKVALLARWLWAATLPLRMGAAFGPKPTDR